MQPGKNDKDQYLFPWSPTGKAPAYRPRSRPRAGQAGVFPKKRPQGANIPYQRTNSPTGRTPAYRQAGVVLLVRDRVGNGTDMTQVDQDLYFDFAKEGAFLLFVQGREKRS